MPERRDNDFKDFQSPHEASVDRLVEALDRAYHRPWLMIWRSFLHGFMTAIGATFGTVIIVVIAGMAFQALGGIELLRPSIDKLQNMITGSIQSQVGSPSNQTPLKQNGTPPY